MNQHKDTVPSTRIPMVQCQSCGYCVESADGALPTGWHESLSRLFFCEECGVGHPEMKPLLGSEYDEEFDPAYYGPNDIGLRAPCDSYFSA